MTTREENLKKINEQLEQAAGGTVTEFSEICSAMTDNPALKKLLGATSHIPIGNFASGTIVEQVLKDQMGIDADISLGFLGTGLGSKANTYKDLRNGGASMSHTEVLERIKAYAYKG